MRKILLLIPIFLFIPSLVHAESGLKISPTSFDLLIKPNTKVVQNIELTNLGESTTYQVEVKKLIPLGTDGGSTIDLSPLDPNTLPLILKLNNQPLTTGKEITLESNSKITSTLEIETASSDVNSEVYLTLTFTKKSESKLGSNPIIGLPLLLTISQDGNLAVNLSLDNFSPHPLVDSFFPFRLTPQIKNNSHHMLRPIGSLVIKNSKGETTDSFNIEPTLILGETTRTINFTNKEDNNKPLRGITLTPSMTRIGPYTLILTLQTPGEKTILESSRVVWFFPIRLAIITLVITLLALAYFVRSKTNHSPR